MINASKFKNEKNAEKRQIWKRGKDEGIGKKKGNGKLKVKNAKRKRKRPNKLENHSATDVIKLEDKKSPLDTAENFSVSR